MTVLALVLACAGLAWMAAVLVALLRAELGELTWPPIPVRVGGRRPSTWQAVWRDAA